MDIEGINYSIGDDKKVVPVPEPKKMTDEIRLIKKELKKKDSIIRNRDKIIQDMSPKRYDIIKDPGKWFHVGKWVRRAKNRLFPDRTYLINMELRNGMYRTFLIMTTQDKFYFMGGRYIIDDSLKHYNIDSECYALDYHQDCSLPIRRKIEVNEIKNGMKELQPDHMRIDNATNPSTLDRFIESEMAKKVMEGQELATMLKRLFAVGVITMISVLVHALLYMKKSGMLDSMRVPGV